MPTLEYDKLVFRFPQIEPDATFAIDFKRTLRIPDSETTYPLPPGLGSFPLRHVEDYVGKLPEQTASRGGVFLPMWQAEAMWLNFRNTGPDAGLRFPVAIKVAAGKINAVTGEIWRAGLHRDPQDYMVSPKQPWLDGFSIERGVIRQFVAMPLGDGYSVEEQITGEGEWGGLQISVTPLKFEVWKRKRSEWEKAQRDLAAMRYGLNEESGVRKQGRLASMGLAAGGRMEQAIHPDPFKLEDWDATAVDRVFITLVHAKDWKMITGEGAPHVPPTAKDYSKAGLPWFEYYGNDQAALSGSAALAGMKSVATLFKKFTGATMPDSADIKTGTPQAIGPGADSGRAVRTSGNWEH